jgi:hypothetical protein
MRWRLVLSVLGLTLFALLTYHSIRFNQEMRQGHPSRYFWWGGIRLDSDPLNKHPRATPSCDQAPYDCGWDPEYIWVDPGLMEKAMVLSALPAFLSSQGVVWGLARLGVNELLSFMVSMPLFIFAWFWAAGWLLDWWRHKQSLRLGPICP